MVRKTTCEQSFLLFLNHFLFISLNRFKMVNGAAIHYNYRRRNAIVEPLLDDQTRHWLEQIRLASGTKGEVSESILSVRSRSSSQIRRSSKLEMLSEDEPENFDAFSEGVSEFVPGVFVKPGDFIPGLPSSHQKSQEFFRPRKATIEGLMDEDTLRKIEELRMETDTASSPVNSSI